jgi:hypothetical protein
MNINTNSKSTATRPINHEFSRTEFPKKGRVLLRYKQPTSSDMAVGKIPENGRVGPSKTGTAEFRYSDTFRPSTQFEQTGWKPIFHEQPYLVDGKPFLKEQLEVVELGPKSGIKSGLLGGVVGTALGSIAAAALVGMGAISGPVGLAVAAVAGVGTALRSAHSSQQTVREIDWVEVPIVSREVEGFRQTVTSHEIDDADGYSETVYRASNQPIISDTNHGSWLKPVVVERPR